MTDDEYLSKDMIPIIYPTTYYRKKIKKRLGLPRQVAEAIRSPTNETNSLAEQL